MAPGALGSVRGWVGAVVGVATVLVVLAYRAGSDIADDYWVTVAISAVAALFLAWQARGTRAVTASRAWQAAGALLVVGALVALGATPRYCALDRFLPLAAGAGLGLAAFGARSASCCRAELGVLALPFLNPVPLSARGLFAPFLVRGTASCAFLLLRAVGTPVALHGSELRTPGGTLEVLEGCCGALAVSRLSVVAGLVVALFPTTALQKVGLFSTAACAGFSMAVAHVAVMTLMVMRGDDAGFEFWHQGGGAALMAVGATGLAGFGWWLMLRRGGEVGPSSRVRGQPEELQD